MQLQTRFIYNNLFTTKSLLFNHWYALIMEQHSRKGCVFTSRNLTKNTKWHYNHDNTPSLLEITLCYDCETHVCARD